MSNSPNVIPKKKLIVSVIGTTTSGKTFLIFNLTKLFTFLGLTKSRLSYTLHPLAKVSDSLNPNKPQIRTLNDLTGDITNNINGTGEGTKHTPLNPEIYEYQYDNILTKVAPTLWERLFKKPVDYNIHFKIRNIPGEMMDVYFKKRQRGGGTTTLDDEFTTFLETDSSFSERLHRFKESTVDDKEEIIELNNLFYDFCKTQISPEQELPDEPQIKRNFYSFLFLRISTDVVICHDISADVNQETQSEIMNYLLPDSNMSIRGMNRYYAFTKYDKCIENPKVNYVDRNLSNDEMKVYWEITENNLRSIYNKKPFIKTELLNEIDRLKQTQPIPKIQSGTENFDLMKYTYFICTNYCNSESRDFKLFDKKSPNGWNQSNYIPDSFPLGCIELLMSLFDRNGFCNAGDLGLGFNGGEYNLLSEAYIDEK